MGPGTRPNFALIWVDRNLCFCFFLRVLWWWMWWFWWFRFDCNCDGLSRACVQYQCSPLALNLSLHTFVSICAQLLQFWRQIVDRSLQSVVRLYQAVLKLALLCLSAAIEAIWGGIPKLWGWSVWGFLHSPPRGWSNKPSVRCTNQRGGEQIWVNIWVEIVDRSNCYGDEWWVVRRAQDFWFTIWVSTRFFEYLQIRIFALGID